MAKKAQQDLAFPQRATVNIERPNPTTEATQRQAGPNFFRDGENVHFMRAEKVSGITYDENQQWLDIKLETKLYIDRTAQTHDSVMHQFIDGEASPGSLWLRIYFFTEDVFRVSYALTTEELDALQEEPSFPFPEARMLVGKRRAVATSFTPAQEGAASVSTSNVTINIQEDPFKLSAIRRGSKAPFWQHRLKDLFTSDHIPTSIARHQDRAAIFESFNIGPSETIYGLGERFDSVSRRGRPVDFVNHDAIGTSNTRSYINVPFFWSTAGYGCFLNSYARTEWDVGMSETGALGFSTEESFMDYFIIAGPKPKDILRAYTHDLTGVCPMLPTWTFGLWLSRNSYTSWDVVDTVIASADKHRIPLDVVHLDTFWFREDWNPDLEFDPIRFANPAAKMASLLASGIHTSLWQYSFISDNPNNKLRQESLTNTYHATAGPDTTDPFTYPPNTSGWKTDDLVMDFSNPATRKWYSDKISTLITQGATAIKTDFGDCNPPDAYYKNVLGRRFQNSYSLAYHATVVDGMRKGTPTSSGGGGSTTNSIVTTDTTQSTNPSQQTPVLWSRAGTAGSQRHPLHWGGDSQCSWTALQGSWFATLSMGHSGFSFFSHDVGGFIGKPNPELYTRWAQTSLLATSHFRAHGAGDGNEREPWAFGEETLGEVRRCAGWRMRLLPWLVGVARRSVVEGVGVVRHLVVEFPGERGCWGVETQGMVGEGVMVVPVLRPLVELEEEMEVYFPRGRWFDFWTGRVVLDARECGRWGMVKTPRLDEVAMYVRGGTAVPLAEEGRLRTFDKVGEVVEVRCYGEPEDAGDVWVVDDGDEGEIQLVRDHGGGWKCANRDNVLVKTY